ncbi:MAG: hypothetical protein ACYTFI_15690 [Planctomycetota bacterium]
MLATASWFALLALLALVNAPPWKSPMLYWTARFLLAPAFPLVRATSYLFTIGEKNDLGSAVYFGALILIVSCVYGVLSAACWALVRPFSGVSGEANPRIEPDTAR